MVYGSGVCRGRHYLARIVVVPGVIPQARGYRSEGRGEAEAESLLGDEAADAGCAEIAELGTISWDGVKADLEIEGAVGLREVTSQVCEDPGESRSAVDRGERGQP